MFEEMMEVPGSVHPEDEFFIFVEVSSTLHGSDFVDTEKSRGSNSCFSDFVRVLKTKVSKKQ